MSEPLYLVTGAAGFVGENIARHLAGQGVRVRAMVRHPDQARALEEIVEEVVIADLQKPETLPAAVEGVAGVYHIAAIFRQEGLSDEVFYEVNAEGVQRMLDASIAAGVKRFLHCSTNGVHSDIEHPPASETYPFNPGDVYQASKLEGERIAMSYFTEGRIEGVVLRPTMIWGPGDLRTLKLFRMIGKGRFFYIGSGSALQHWVDVRDVARAFQLAMEASDINGEAFLIGGSRYLPLREVVGAIADELGVQEPHLHMPVRPMMLLAHATEIVCKPLGIEPPLFRRRVSFFLKDRAYDISKAHNMLGFKPRGTFAEEVCDIVADYRARGWLSGSSMT